MEAATWPARVRAIMAPPPMRGARITVAVTKNAPMVPPIQYHHGEAL